jgi:hypothetical protein
MPVSDRLGLRGDVLQTLVIVMIMLFTAAIPLWLAYEGVASRQALKTEWAISGPACPVVTQTVRYHRPAQSFRYKGVGFQRQYGNVYCEPVPNGGLFSRTTHAVCQFNAPTAIHVTTARGTVIYEPGVGRPATVTVRDGRPSCVIGGWFR